MKFEDLGLSGPILKALISKGYFIPTPIQAQSIPHLLEGRDLYGTAQTGTGKTASFAIPLLQKLASRPSQQKRQVRGLVLAPTRELALQIAENIALYGKNLDLRHVVIYGGVSQHKQTQTLQRGVDIIIATPGRLIDLVNQKFINLSNVEMLVLDEADRMLDMGFINDIKRISAMTPRNRQTVLFSATFPKTLHTLVKEMLNNPVYTEVGEVSSPVEKINQMMYYVNKINKPDLLHLLLKEMDVESMLVFTRTKRGADKVMKDMRNRGISAGVIHGNKSQNDRNKTLDNFKQKRTKVLVATDVASRGIDVDHISHVINFDLPETPETYVHRIGRTGRAGAAGTAVSFCSHEEKDLMRDVNRHLKSPVVVVESIFSEAFRNNTEIRPAVGSPRNDRRNNSASRNKSYPKRTGSYSRSR
ncbi:MAG: DEAD/DEAH box helicase [Bacteroidia bacterium]